MKNLWAGKVEKVEKKKIAKFQISKNRKKQKKQNFQILTKNSVTIMELSKRKQSWVFFEIGIKNKKKVKKKGHFFD